METMGEVRFIGTVEETGESSTIKVFPEFCPGLLGIERYSHLIVLYWFHQRDNQEHRETLQVIPPRHRGAPLTGVFASRSPSRPNPLGFTVVELESVDGCRIVVRGLDALKGSPVVDLKPYLPESDGVLDASVPGYMKHM